MSDLFGNHIVGFPTRRLITGKMDLATRVIDVRFKITFGSLIQPIKMIIGGKIDQKLFDIKKKLPCCFKCKCKYSFFLIHKMGGALMVHAKTSLIFA